MERTKKTDVAEVEFSNDIKSDSLSFERVPTGAKIYKVEPFNMLFFVVKGEMDFSVKKEKFSLSALDLAFVPAMSIYSVFCQPDSEVWCLKFGQKYAEDFSACYPKSSIKSIFTDKKKNTRIKQVLFLMQNTRLTELEKITYVNGVFVEIVSAYGVVEESSSSETRIAEVVSYIYKNFDKDVSLESLAKEFCISKMDLSRKISRYVGVDLRVFVNDIRIRSYIKMRADKRYAHLSAVELAYRCGFKSYATFYRAYKRRVADFEEQK